MPTVINVSGSCKYVTRHTANGISVAVSLHAFGTVQKYLNVYVHLKTMYNDPTLP